ncbi:MAG TPA: hypothetical protein VMH23_03365 [Bacteroidota bacterium]|nr:hypothetical protein [Bacteroidota bacterium]
MKETSIRCGDPHLDALYPRIRNFLMKDVTEYNMFGTRVRGYRTPDTPSLWIRDYSDMMRGFRYWESDMKSIVDHFAETQTAHGWLFDYFTMTPEKVPCEKENWAKYVRVPVEADVEYRFIKALYLAWQATGDDQWVRSLMPVVEKALNYVLTDEWRWDTKTKLVKRGYTIDTWDFDYTAGRHPWLNFQINDDTYWGIMHGDSSGFFEAFSQVAALYSVLGQKKKAVHWGTFAEKFRRRANKVSFNGRFYTHHVHLVPVHIDGVDESEQLSLSNPMNINRGLATHAMAVSIIREYRKRGAALSAFADWFSIDPPMPDGIYGDEKLVGGAYCNGGLLPLVGGELAKAAFEHGFEEYGVEQLLKYEQLTNNNETYLWYFPDGKPSSIETSTSPDASPTDGWGSSAMLYAMMEGLAGVVDRHKLYEQVSLSPRWIAAGRDEAQVCAAYGASGASFEYSFAHSESSKTIELQLKGTSSTHLHVLLPRGTKAVAATVNGKKMRFANSSVEESSYVDADLALKKKAVVEFRYQQGS